jgi:hypothetical protein
MTKQTIMTAILVSAISMNGAFAENAVTINPTAAIKNAATTELKATTDAVKSHAQKKLDSKVNAINDTAKTIEKNTTSDVKNTSDQAKNATSDVKNNIKEYAKDTQKDAVNIKTNATIKADANNKNKSDDAMRSDANKKDDSALNAETSNEETGSINTQQDTGIISKIMSFFKS